MDHGKKISKKSTVYSVLDFKALFDAALDLYLILDPHLNIVEASDSYLRAMMIKREEIIGRELFRVFPGNHNDTSATSVKNLLTSLERVLQNKAIDIIAVQKYNIRCPESEGGGMGERYLSQVNTPVFDEDNHVKYIIHRVEDVTEQQQATEISERILEAVPDPMIMINNHGKIIFVNGEAEKVFGYEKNELIGQAVEMLIPEPYRSRHFRHRHDFSNAPHTRPMGIGMVLYGQRKNKEIFPVEISLRSLETKDGMNTLASIRDITERKQAEKEIFYLSSHDVLTHLHNRAAFTDALKKELENSSLNHTSLAVLILDLDNFKTVNDTFGHHIGDQLLITVAKQLQESVRKEDFVARLGGDEFVIIFPNIKDEADIEIFAQKLIKGFNKPLKLENHYFHATVSIGIAVSPGSGKDEVTLIKNADIALYSVKGHGRNNYQFFSDKINTVFKHRSQLESGLSAAIEKNQFYLVYQPQYNLPDMQIIGIEALIRWEHPELGLIMPGDFIPIAEKSGFIVQIREWLLRTACSQYVTWQSKYVFPNALKLVVNLSSRQLSKNQLINSIMTILADTGMLSENLELGLTEAAVMTSMIDIDSILEKLQSMGISFSIHDFGAGYSSLSRLKKLPASSLKIDKSFINDLDTDSDDAMIVKSIIALGNSLGLNVILEGVETEKQLQLFIKYHGQIAQSFYFGKDPLRYDEMTYLLQANLPPIC